MKKIIIISGDLASGKTTLANNLSKRLDWPSFKKDTFKEVIVDLLDFENREQNKRISVLTMDVLLSVSEELMKHGNDFIFEANFHHDEIENILQKAKKYQYEVAFFFLYGNMKTLYQRFLERVPNRHKAHLSIHLEDSLEKFKDYIETSRKDIEDYPFVTIDTTSCNTTEVLDKAWYVLKEKGFR